MAYLLYNTFLTCLLILSAPYFLLRSLFQERFRKELIQRIGFFPLPRIHHPVWVHAASVGEVFCSIPLLRRIKKEFPNLEILLTTMTRTGNHTARTYFPEAASILYLPVDHPLILRRTIQKAGPGLLLIAETELWPNLLRCCGKEGIPIVLFNGRISQKSLRGYLFLRFFFEECLRYVSLFLMQTEEDRNRIIEIGAPFEKTKVLGNLKFDQTFPSFAQGPVTEMSAAIHRGGKETVLIAGSTHPGEEEILLGLFEDLIQIDPHLLLILAPRHLERLDEVKELLKKAPVSWARKTSFLTDPKETQVILVDTMGELMGLYSLGTLVFVGGSLVPVGGHNPLEPLHFKKCVLFGPYMFNFRDISRRLIQAGGAIQAEGREDLGTHLRRLLSNERARREIGEKGYQFLQHHRGATERVMEEIRPFLERIEDGG
jgi:3-deoxy-D-manno-octulosonic-acid transferase